MTQRDMQAGTQAHRATRASQRRIGSTPPRIERIPVPYRACNAPALVRGIPPGTQKQKGARYAGAFRKINLAGIAGIYASLAPYCS